MRCRSISSTTMSSGTAHRRWSTAESDRVRRGDVVGHPLPKFRVDEPVVDRDDHEGRGGEDRQRAPNVGAEGRSPRSAAAAPDRHHRQAVRVSAARRRRRRDLERACRCRSRPGRRTRFDGTAPLLELVPSQPILREAFLYHIPRGAGVGIGQNQRCELESGYRAAACIPLIGKSMIGSSGGRVIGWSGGRACQATVRSSRWRFLTTDPARLRSYHSRHRRRRQRARWREPGSCRRATWRPSGCAHASLCLRGRTIRARRRSGRWDQRPVSRVRRRDVVRSQRSGLRWCRGGR